MTPSKRFKDLRETIQLVHHGVPKPEGAPYQEGITLEALLTLLDEMQGEIDSICSCTCNKC